MMAACQPKRAGLARLVALSVWATLVVSITDAFVPPKPVSRRKTPQLFMGGLTLYGSPGSRSPLVNWAAYELGLDLVMGDLNNNPHPFGQIPCLTHDNDDNDEDDIVVFESGAILVYLNSLANHQDLLLSKSSSMAAITSWISWANASLDPICFLEIDGKVYDTGLKKPNRRVERLNALLGESAYLVQDTFSLADVAVASYLLYVVQFFPTINLTRWPNLVRYMRDCASRPSYQQAFGTNVQSFLLERLDIMMEKEDDNKKNNNKKLFGMF